MKQALQLYAMVSVLLVVAWCHAEAAPERNAGDAPAISATPPASAAPAATQPEVAAPTVTAIAPVNAASRPQFSDPVWSDYYRAVGSRYYFDGMAAYYSWLSGIATACLAIAGIVGFVGPFIHESYYELWKQGPAKENRVAGKRIAFAWMVVGLVALLLSTWASFAGWQDKYVKYSILSQRWGDLARRLEHLDQQTPSMFKADFDRRLADIQSEISRVEFSEPPVEDTEYQAECQRMANKFLRVGQSADSKQTAVASARP